MPRDDGAAPEPTTSLAELDDIALVAEALDILDKVRQQRHQSRAVKDLAAVTTEWARRVQDQRKTWIV